MNLHSDYPFWMIKEDLISHFPTLKKDLKTTEVPFETDFTWAGTFAETADGLPYIGSYDNPQVLYAMGYGRNGITFSVAAAEILRDAVLGKKNKDAKLFGFDRK